MKEGIIKSARRLKLLTMEQHQALAQAALQQYQAYGLVFHVLKWDTDYIIRSVQTQQSKEPLCRKEIISITRNLFGPYCQGKHIKVQPVPILPV